MKVQLNKLAGTIILLFLISFCALGKAKTINLVYINKHQEILNPHNARYLAQVSTFTKQLQQKPDNSPTMLLHGGDALFSNHLSQFDSAKHFISLANIMGVNVYAPGTSDFVFGADQISLRAEEANFPIVATNTIDNRSNLEIESTYSIFTININNKKIAIASSVLADRLVHSNNAVDGVHINYNVFKDTQIRKALKEADISILMAVSLNPESDAYLHEMSLTSESVPYLHEINRLFDLVFVYYNHHSNANTVYSPLVVYPKQNFKDVLHVTIDDQNNITSRHVDISALRPDAKVMSYINQYQDFITQTLSTPIAKVSHNFNTHLMPVRTTENPMGNIITDALREYAKADIAIINSGAIRGNTSYAAGHTLTRLDILNELPFGHTLKIIKISGHNIKAMMENSVSEIENARGKFLHFSGMSMTFDPEKPVGKRVKEILVNGQKLQPNQSYSLALSNYLLNGGDDYTMFEDITPLNTQSLQVKFTNIVTNFILNKEEVNSQTSGRIINMVTYEN